MATKPDTPKNGSKLATALVAAVGAFVGGGGILSLYVGTPIGQQVFRSDPFTGSEGDEIRADIGMLEQRVSTVERRVDKLPPLELQLAIGLMRAEIDRLTQRVNQLEE